MIPLGLGGKLLGLLAVVAAAHFFMASLVAKGRAECQADYAAAALAAQAEDARTQAEDGARTRRLYDTYRKSAEREAARAADLRGQLDRLRDAAATADRAPASAASAASGVDATGGLGPLLVEGGELAEEGRGNLARMADKVTALQDYITNVCRPAPE